MARTIQCTVCYETCSEHETVCHGCGTTLDWDNEKINNEYEDDSTFAEGISKECEEYYVRCAESNSEIIIENKDQESFYCENCEMTHTIGGIGPQINVRIKKIKKLQSTKLNELILEERVTGHQFSISQEGGIFGRYGDFEPEIFQNENWEMISGQHLIITSRNGDWYIKHIGSNRTILDGMKLEKEIEVIIRAGQVLALANICFMVIIGAENVN